MNTRINYNLPVRKEIICLDSFDRPCDRKSAFRVIVKEYDMHGRLVKCLMSIDPGKDHR